MQLVVKPVSVVQPVVGGVVSRKRHLTQSINKSSRMRLGAESRHATVDGIELVGSTSD